MSTPPSEFTLTPVSNNTLVYGEYDPEWDEMSDTESMNSDDSSYSYFDYDAEDQILDEVTPHSLIGNALQNTPWDLTFDPYTNCINRRLSTGLCEIKEIQDIDKSTLSLMIYQIASDVNATSIPQVQAIPGMDVMVNLITKKVKKYVTESKVVIDMVASMQDMLTNIIETSVLTLFLVNQSHDWKGVIAALLMGIKTISRKNLLTSASTMCTKIADYVHQLFGHDAGIVQAEAECDFASVIKMSRKLLTNFQDVKNSVAVQKLTSMFQYFLSFGTFECLGLTFEKLHYGSLQEEFIKRTKCNTVDFFLTVYDGVTFMLERGVQSITAGTLLPFFHSEDTYAQWAIDAKRIEEDSHKLVNAEACGLNLFKYTADLSNAISKGESIVKFAKKGKEKENMENILRSLRLISANLITKKAAQEKRVPPFAVTIAGDSSVAKSSFTQIVFRTYAEAFSLPSEDCYKYVRNCQDKYWSNFDTSKWCIVFDDAAMYKPGTLPTDPSLIEIIPVVNEVNFCPPMADIADKGKHPVKARLVIVTTNTEDLNCHHYFTCPLATQRRMKYIIRLTVKPEFAEEVSGMIDPSKAALSTEEYPNFWHIEVMRVTGVKAVSAKGLTTDRCQAKIVPLTDYAENIVEFDDVYDFCEFFAILARTAASYQDANMASANRVASVAVCKHCCRPQSRCTCPVEQYGPEPEDAIQFGPSVQAQSFFDAHTGYERLDAVATWMAHPVESYSELYDRVTFPFEDQSYMQKVQANLCAGVEDVIIFSKMQAAHMHTFVTKQYHDFIPMVEKHIVNLWTAGMINEFKSMGKRICVWLSSIKVLVFSSCLAGLGAVYSLYKTFQNQFVGVQATESVDIPVSPTIAPHLSRQVGQPLDVAHDESANPWYQEEVMLHKFDLGSSTSPLSKATDDQICDLIHKNVLHLSVRYEGDDGTAMRVEGNCLGLAGHLYVTDHHIFPPCKKQEYLVEVISWIKNDGINPNTFAHIVETDLYRDVANDRTFVRFFISPKKDIRGYFPKVPLRGAVTNGFILSREVDGTMTRNCLTAMKDKQMYVPTHGRTYDSIDAIADHETIMGSCGSPYVAMYPAGPAIVALQQTWLDGHCTGVRLTQQDIDVAEKHYGDVLVTQGQPCKEITNLVPLHKKSPLRFFKQGQGKIYGSEPHAFRSQPKSKVERTIISECATKLGYTTDCGPPCLKGWEPLRVSVEPTLIMDHKIDQSALEECVKGFCADIDRDLDPKWLKEIVILDDMTTINGAPGVKFVDKMKRNTSMGYPWKTSKKKFLKYLDPIDGIQDPVDFTEEIYVEIDRVMAAYQRGERAHPVFVASLKDTPTPLKKIKAKKTRVFQCGNGPWSFVARKYLLSFIRVFQKNSEVFEGAPGINHTSKQWERLHDYLTKFGDDTCIDGDFRFYDKHMEAILILAAFKVIMHILKRAGWKENDIRSVQCIAEDIAYALCDFFGDIIEFCGANPSGQPLTVIVNCLVNSLYMRYCYLKLNPAKTCITFKEFVHLMTYGDDNAMNVSKLAPWFNHTAIASVLLDIDVEYTMADKNAESVPYIPFDKISFLKRKWVYNADVLGGVWLAPLDFSSVGKMLNVGLKNNFLCPEEQAVAVISSAMGEFFHYGRSEYDRHSENMKIIIRECKLENFVTKSTLPSWDDLCDRFQKGSLEIALDHLLSTSEEEEEN